MTVISQRLGGHRQNITSVNGYAPPRSLDLLGSSGSKAVDPRPCKRARCITSTSTVAPRHASGLRGSCLSTGIMVGFREEQTASRRRGASRSTPARAYRVFPTSSTNRMGSIRRVLHTTLFPCCRAPRFTSRQGRIPIAIGFLGSADRSRRWHLFVESSVPLHRTRQVHGPIRLRERNPLHPHTL